MLISNKKSLNVKQSITFIFKEDIDKVFACFFNPKILAKIGFFNNKITNEHFPLKKVKYEYITLLIQLSYIQWKMLLKVI